jgi:hypothetical protein
VRTPSQSDKQISVLLANPIRLLKYLLGSQYRSHFQELISASNERLKVSGHKTPLILLLYALVVMLQDERVRPFEKVLGYVEEHFHVTRRC